MFNPSHHKKAAAQAMLKKERVYGLSHTTDDGVSEYYFILIEPVKEKAFQRALCGTSAVRLEDFGTVVGYGRGEPSPQLKARTAAFTTWSSTKLIPRYPKTESCGFSAAGALF